MTAGGLDADEFAAWLRLLETPGVGRESARRLLARFGSAQAVFDASAAALREVAPAAAATALQREPDGFAERLRAAEAWRSADAQRHVVVLGDPAYPERMLQSPDPPLLLYVQGRLEALSAPGLAIVGSRNPTPQGRDNAREFAAQLARDGLMIASGLALGIDGAAHEGALAAGGRTVAVMGTGPDRIYPGRHRDLAHRIAASGALVTEFPPGTPALPQQFPQRNRILAGMTLGTLVVEAALRSGSLITARLAAEAGREVFALPGSIHSPLARGCHALIKQGAKLVESAHDVLDELRLPPAPSEPSRKVDPQPVDPLLDALGHDPATLDQLLARTGRSVQDLGARLLELELEGRVARLPGGLFQRRGRG